MRRFFLLIILLTCLPAFAVENNYKVLKVVDGDTIYLDFNSDGIIQKTEKVRLNGIDTFEVKTGEILTKQSKFYGFSEQEALALGYLAKEFAKEKLLGKYVRASYSSKRMYDIYGRILMSVYYHDKKGRYKSYEEEILKRGLAVVYRKSNLKLELLKYENIKKLRENAKSTDTFNLVILDINNNVYYSPYCKYTHGKGFFELVNISENNTLYQKGICPDEAQPEAAP